MATANNLKTLEDAFLAKQNSVIQGSSNYDDPNSKREIDRQYNDILSKEYSKNYYPTRATTYEGTNEFVGQGTYSPLPGLQYDKYLEGYLPWQDMYDYKASNQSVGEQIAIGTGRLIGTTATKALEGLGYAATALPALFTGNADLMLDNGFSAAFSSVEESIKEALPIHHKSAYYNGNILQQMATFGFWMDDVVDGAAFMLSNLVGSAGVSAVGKGLGAYTKLAKTFSNASKAVKTGNALGKAAPNLTKFVNLVDLGTMSLYNSVTEAAFEAKDLKDSLLQEGLSNEEASGYAMNTFWLNVGALMGPNMLTNSLIFKPFKGSKGKLNTIFKNGKLTEELQDLTKGDIASAFGKNMLKSMASEGLWEENIQLAIQNYQTNLSLGEEDRPLIQGLAEEWVNNFTTDEGQKSIALGAIIGALPGGFGGVKDVKGERKALQSKQRMMGLTLAAFDGQANTFLKRKQDGSYEINPETGKPLIDYEGMATLFKSKLQTLSNTAATAIAVEAGNKTMFDFLREERFGNLALAFLDDPDGLQHLKNQIDVYAKEELDALSNADNYTDETSVEELSASYKQKAEKYQSIYDSIVNNYLAFADFGDTQEGNRHKVDLMRAAFLEAVNQNFWVNKKDELEGEIAKLELDQESNPTLNSDEIKRLQKEVTDIDSLIETSRETFKELVNVNKQEKDFKEYQKNKDKNVEEVRKREERRKEEAKKAAEPKRVVTADGKEYLLTGFKNGKYELLDLESESPEGNVYRFTPEEFDDLGPKFVDEKGNLTYATEPTIYLGDDNTEYIYEGKVKGKYRLRDTETNHLLELDRSEFVKYKLNTGTIEQVKEEVGNIQKERERLIKEEAARVANIINTPEGQMARESLQRLIREEFGDSTFDDSTLEDIVSNIKYIKTIPAVFNGMIGELSLEDNVVLFTEIGKKIPIEVSRINIGNNLPIKDLGISILKNFIFDIELVADGRTFNINGTYLNNLSDNPVEAIIEDNEGNPDRILLYNDKNKPVVITNPLIVRDLANAILTVEEAREATLDKIKEDDEHFVFFADGPETTDRIRQSFTETGVGELRASVTREAGKPVPRLRKFAVYNVNGLWKVLNPRTGKGYDKKIEGRVLNRFFNELQNKMQQYVNLVKELNQGLKDPQKTNIKDELKRINDLITPATPAEINRSKSAPEVPSTERTQEKPPKQTDEQVREGSKETDNIVKDKADKKAAKNVDEALTDKPTKKVDLDSSELVEPVNDTEIGKEGEVGLNVRRNALNSLSWDITYNAENNPELDQYLSDKDNTLKNVEAEFVIDYDLSLEDSFRTLDFWKNNPELKSKLRDKELTENDIKEILQSKAKTFYSKGGERKDFNTVVDNIPIRVILRSKDGTKVPEGKVYMHLPSWYNINVPDSIALQGQKIIDEYKNRIRLKARGNRTKILTKMLLGNKVIIEDISKTSGFPNNLPVETDGNVIPFSERNNSILQVFNVPQGDIRLAITDNANIIRDGEGRDLSVSSPSGSPGNVFYITTDTANGEMALVKLNSSKISDEHARLLYRALVQSRKKDAGGYSQLMKDPKVENLTVGEVIKYLVLEGKGFTDQTSKDVPKSYLKNKELWVENGKIHFGKNTPIPVDGTATKEQIETFVNWAKANKNYVINKNLLGKPLSKDFKLGSFVGKKGEIYDGWLAKNKAVLTDLNPDRPFHSPIIKLDYNSIKIGEGSKQPQPKSTPTKSVKEVKATKKKVEAVKLLSGEDFKNLQPGTILYNEAVSFDKNGKRVVNKIEMFRVEDKDGVTKLIALPDYADEFKSYSGAKITETKVLDNLTLEFDPIHPLMYIQDTEIKPKEVDEPSGESSAAILNKFKPFNKNVPPSLVPFNVGKYKKIDVEKELAWLKERLPEEKIELVDDLISIGGRLAWGQLLHDGIILSTVAREGTLYHEAFHRVMLSYTSDEQRRKIYDAARRVYGKEFTDYKIGEILADRFKEYVLADNKTEVTKSLPTIIAEWFKRIFDHIMTFFSDGRSTDRLDRFEIERVFESINKGNYKSAKPQLNNEYFKSNPVYLSDATDFTANQKSVVTKNLMFLAFHLNNIDKLSDIENLNFGPVYEEIVKLRDAYKREGNENLYEIHSTIVDNFDTFVSMVERYMLGVGITSREAEELEDDYNKGLDLVAFDQAPYETNMKDNLLSSIKMLIMTLPSSEEVDEFTGLWSFVDFNTTWNKIMNDLHKEDDIYGMMDVLERKQSNNPEYSELLFRLKDGTEQLRTQFEVSVKLNKHKFIDSTFTKNPDGTYKFNFQTTDVQKASKKFVDEWSQLLYDSPIFEGKYKKISKSKINTLFERFDRVKRQAVRYNSTGVFENYNESIEELIDIFNTLSIPLDHVVLDNILTSKEEYPDNEGALKDFIVNDVSQLFSKNSIIYKVANDIVVKNNKGETIENNKLFSDESSVRFIAEHYIMSKPEEMPVTVLGPNGNAYFTYSPNSFISDIVREINKSKDKVETMMSSVFTKNSYLLNQLKVDSDKRTNFFVNTYSGFIEVDKNTSDAGRDYLQINDAEDFLFKLAAINSGRIRNNPKKGILPLPSLADRRVYHLYNGLDILDLTYNVDETGALRLPLDSEVVDVFSSYIEAERSRIELVRKQVDEVTSDIKNADISKLVENLHYKLSNETKGATKYKKLDDGLFMIFKNSSGNYVGNGTRFQHFSIFNKDIGNTSEVKIKDVRRRVERMLLARTMDTIRYASTIGVIDAEFNDKGIATSITNKLIDSDLISEIAGSEFNGNEYYALRKIFANYTANMIMGGIETEMMLSGDVAFYKGNSTKRINEDKVKRLSPLTSTGANLRTSFPPGHPLHGKTTYTTATLNTHLLSSVYYDQLYDTHMRYYTEVEGMDEKTAAKTVERKLKAYTEVDQTDAQVYISASMYESILERLGELSEEKREALKLLESDKELTLEEEQNALNIVLPPLKTVYFDLNYRDGLAIPTFDKMSMAPLFKRFVKGTDLEHLLDRMEKRRKIDIETGETIYDYTGEEYEEIHAIKQDTSVKVGGIPKFNYFKDDLRTVVNDFSKRDFYTQKQPFSRLRRQLVTEPHDTTETLFGTQVKKILLSNINKEDLYNIEGETEAINGQTIIDTVMQSLSELSNRGKEQLFHKLGMEKTGDLVDMTKLAKLLREDARKSGMSENVISALSIDPETGKMILPFDALPERKWIYSRFIALVNKHTVDLKMPGNAFIQMSNFGFKKVYDDNLKNYESKIEWFEEATTDLKFYRTEGDRVEPMECVVSVNMFKSIIPNYDNLTFEEKAEFVKNNPYIMGYRIPTQGLNSTSAMKVVGLLREQVGDTIMLPSEFTALTGSDFDIDKLYAVRYNYEVTGKDITDIKKVPFLTEKNSTPKERIDAYAPEAVKYEIDMVNSEYARKIKAHALKIEMSKKDLNDIFEKIGDLKDKRDLDFHNQEFWRSEISEKYEEVEYLQDLKADNYDKINAIKEERDKIVEKLIEDWKTENRSTFFDRPIVSQNRSEAIENKLLDNYFAVLTSKHHITQTTTPLDASTELLKKIAFNINSWEDTSTGTAGSLYFLSPEYQAAVKAKYSGGKQGIGPFALNNVHHVLGQIVNLGLKTDIGIGNVNTNGFTDLSGIKDMNGEYILDWLSALINAHVDIAKDPYIFDLNINNRTYAITSLLVRAGVGEQAFYFLPQPILKEVSKEAALQGGKIRTKITGRGGKELKPVSIVKARYTKLYNEALIKEKLKDEDVKISENVWDLDTLQSDIKSTTKKNAAYYKRQLQILKRFTELDKQAYFLNDVVMSSTVDTKGYGKNLSELMAFKNAYKVMRETNALDGINNLFNDTFLSTYYTNSVDLITKLFSEQTITGTELFANTVLKIAELSGNKDTKDATLISFISDELFASVASSFFTNEEGFNMDSNKVSKLFFSKDGLVNNLYAIKAGSSQVLIDNPELAKNRLINLIQTDFDIDNVNPAKIRVQSTSIKEAWDKEDIMRSWEDLLNHRDPKVQKLARGLVLYSFYTSGFSKNIFSFFEYIPTSYLHSVGYGKFMYDVLSKFKDGDASDIVNNAIRDVFRNNWGRTKKSIKTTKDLVPKVDLMSMKDREYLKDNDEPTIVIAEPDIEVENSVFLGYTMDNVPIYKPYIYGSFINDNYLYSYIGYNSTNKFGYYRLVPKKGYNDRGFQIKEYGIRDSIIKDNSVTYNKGTSQEIEKYMSDNNIVKPNMLELEIAKETLDYIDDPDKSPFLSDAEIESQGDAQVIFSTEPKSVAELLQSYEVKKWEELSDDQINALYEEYKNCKGI